jgi:hypothetical protein
LQDGGDGRSLLMDEMRRPHISVPLSVQRGC